MQVSKLKSLKDVADAEEAVLTQILLELGDIKEYISEFPVELYLENYSNVDNWTIAGLTTYDFTNIVSTLKKQGFIDKIEGNYLKLELIGSRYKTEHPDGNNIKIDFDLCVCTIYPATNFFELLEQRRRIDKPFSDQTPQFGATTINNDKNEHDLKSMHLVSSTLEPSSVIFLVLNSNFHIPIRYAVKNKNGGDAYIKKLYNIAYLSDVPGKKVSYDKKLASNINNALFRKRQVKKFMRTNKFNKPTLVQKSEDKKYLVLKNEIAIETVLIKNIPTQFQYIYKDKTR